MYRSLLLLLLMLMLMGTNAAEMWDIPPTRMSVPDTRPRKLPTQTPDPSS